MQKSTLGIDNLLSELSINQTNPALLDIDLISPDPLQPRKLFNDESIAELSESIKKHGLLQPILVQRKDDKYIIIAGERRYRASKLAGLKSIPAQVTHFDDEKKLEVGLIENIQREDLNPLDIALALSALMKTFGITQEEVAKKIAKSRSYVANVLRLLVLPEEIQKEIRAGKISYGHAKILGGCANPAELVDEIISKNLSVRETERKIKERRGGVFTSRPQTQQKNEDTVYIEQKIEEKFGLKATLEIDSEGKGKIMLNFNNLDDLDLFLGSIDRI